MLELKKILQSCFFLRYECAKNKHIFWGKLSIFQSKMSFLNLEFTFVIQNIKNSAVLDHNSSPEMKILKNTLMNRSQKTWHEALNMPQNSLKWD
jgi:hypothetical protein